MNIFLVLSAAYAMGFITAIPIGATQIEIAKRALNRKFLAAWMVIIGSVVSDVMYGGIALFGVAPFLKRKLVVALFELVGVIILWILAYSTFNKSGKANILNVNNGYLGRKRLALLTGFGLAITNPMIIFWWLLEVRFVINIGLVDSFSKTISALFLLFGGLGLGSYLLFLAAVLYRVKKYISNKAMKVMYKIMGFVLLLLSIYFLYHSVKYFAG